MQNELLEKIILWSTTLILVILEIVALGMDSHYKFDFIFLMLLLFGVYFIRKRINLHWFHYMLFALFLLMHDLGMFKAYNLYLFGLEYDYLMHGVFGFIAALILLRAGLHSNIKSPLMRYLLVIFLILGASALHELYEFGGAVTLGEGEGVLFIGAGDIDEWDTQKDMLNNFIGSIIGIIVYAPILRLSSRKKLKKKKSLNKS